MERMSERKKRRSKGTPRDEQLTIEQQRQVIKSIFFSGKDKRNEIHISRQQRNFLGVAINKYKALPLSYL